MKICAILLFLLSGLLAACTTAASMTPQVPSKTPEASTAITQSPSRTFPPTTALTSTPTQSAADYCAQLLKNYHPAAGFQTYCDADYGFALDYPQDWKITSMPGSPDTPSYPIQVRRSQWYATEGMSNYVRTDTYLMYGSLTLRDRVDNSIFYPGRTFPVKSYPSLTLGGKKAYAIPYCWQPDYSSVMLFFQHGEYYTILEIKAISRDGLDTNWQIARSLQTPGSPPEKNVIPQELIDDSYQLLDCHVPPTAQPGTEPKGTTTRTPTPTSTLLTDTPVRLAFVSNMDGETALYKISSDGSALTRLTNQPMLIMHPTWSPDGRRIAFEACRGGDISTDCPEGESFDIYTVNADGTSLTNLTPNPAMDRFPSWSPDGKIAFSSDRSGKDEIYVMNSDGTGVEQISNGQTRNSEPKWSPDGRRLAYHCADEQSTNICIQLYGSSEQVIKVTGTSPVWSQLSATGVYLLAFHCWSQAYSDICISKPDGTEVVNLTNNAGDDIDPSWSPDGQWIAFQSNMYNDISIYKVCTTCAENKGFIRLTGDEYNANWPIWSPDGNWIAFLSDSDLYIMRADGGDQRLLATDVLGPPAWRP